MGSRVRVGVGDGVGVGVNVGDGVGRGVDERLATYGDVAPVEKRAAKMLSRTTPKKTGIIAMISHRLFPDLLREFMFFLIPSLRSHFEKAEPRLRKGPSQPGTLHRISTSKPSDKPARKK